jgi:hypothetical protein
VTAPDEDEVVVAVVVEVFDDVAALAEVVADDAVAAVAELVTGVVALEPVDDVAVEPAELAVL